MKCFVGASLLLLGLAPFCARGEGTCAEQTECATCIQGCKACGAIATSGAVKMDLQQVICIEKTEECPTIDHPLFAGLQPIRTTLGLPGLAVEPVTSCNNHIVVTDKNSLCSTCTAANWCAITVTDGDGKAVDGHACRGSTGCDATQFTDADPLTLTAASIVSNCPACAASKCSLCGTSCNWCAPSSVGLSSSGEYSLPVLPGVGVCSESCDTHAPGALGSLYDQSAANGVTLDVMTRSVIKDAAECLSVESSKEWALPTCAECLALNDQTTTTTESTTVTSRRLEEAATNAYTWCEIESTNTYGDVEAMELGGICVTPTECASPNTISFTAATSEASVTSTTAIKQVDNCETARVGAAAFLKPSVCAAVGVVGLAAVLT